MVFKQKQMSLPAHGHIIEEREGDYQSENVEKEHVCACVCLCVCVCARVCTVCLYVHSFVVCVRGF